MGNLYLVSPWYNISNVRIRMENGRRIGPIISSSRAWRIFLFIYPPSRMVSWGIPEKIRFKTFSPPRKYSLPSSGLYPDPNANT